MTYKKNYHLHALCIALMDCDCLLSTVFKSLSVTVDPALDYAMGSRCMVKYDSGCFCEDVFSTSKVDFSI